MRYAQIKDGVVKNIIVLADQSLKPLFGSDAGFNALIRIVGINPEPQIGWLYNDDTQAFTPNEEE